MLLNWHRNPYTVKPRWSFSRYNAIKCFRLNVYTRKQPERLLFWKQKDFLWTLLTVSHHYIVMFCVYYIQIQGLPPVRSAKAVSFVDQESQNWAQLNEMVLAYKHVHFIINCPTPKPNMPKHCLQLVIQRGKVNFKWRTHQKQLRRTSSWFQQIFSFSFLRS